MKSIAVSDGAFGNDTDLELRTGEHTTQIWGLSHAEAIALRDALLERYPLPEGSLQRLQGIVNVNPIRTVIDPAVFKVRSYAANGFRVTLSTLEGQELGQEAGLSLNATLGMAIEDMLMRLDDDSAAFAAAEGEG